MHIVDILHIHLTVDSRAIEAQAEVMEIDGLVRRELRGLHITAVGDNGGIGVEVDKAHRHALVM